MGMNNQEKMESRLMKRLFVLLVVAFFSFAVAAQENNPATVNLGGSWGDFGLFLVDADGISLYTYANDTEGLSTCYEECAELAPPLLLGEEEFPSIEAGVTGRLSVTLRDDGSRQVTYNGKPLYYYHEDTEAGQVMGHFRDEEWFVAYPPLLGLLGNEELGRFLGDERGLALYTFAEDSAGESKCFDECAENWPPLLVPSQDSLKWQEGLVGDFGLIERGDRWQVTFNGQPLYFFSGDDEAGEANGQGLGDTWFVARVNTVSLREDGSLAAPNGMSLYTLANDSEGTSTCLDDCAAVWPALSIAQGEELLLGEGLNADDFSTIEREDGSLQVAYQGKPLYTYAYDVLPSDTKGDGLGEVWSIAKAN
jgi:predicted lipoprotein with Yx(FWY)xxD motif